MLDSLSAARRRFVLLLAALVSLVVLIVAVVVVLEVSRRDPAVRPVAQDAQPPVLLVPGYGGSRSDLEVLAKALRAAGREATVVRLAGDGTGDLRAQAKVLDDAARKAIEASGAASVDVVGYSAGGVTARLWVRERGGDALARRVVTLGSPHHGTDLASLAGDIAPDACPVACRQLASDSSVLRSLNAGDESPRGPVWVSIWTEDDKTVVPPDSASLEGALDFSVQSICPADRVSHGGLPSDPAVVSMTLRELRRRLPSPPPGSVC